MKFLLDAQLPSSLKQVFIRDMIVFTRSIWDKIINAVSVAEQRILITKESDFFDSFIAKNEPYKLILVKPGQYFQK
ncbi:MAG TPA: DUF5615 family PIN-like protein [Chitinophagaceae bacterium]|nr:DUF5615 family PIN-like protein [Chitinophagaceae bacterium]